MNFLNKSPQQVSFDLADVFDQGGEHGPVLGTGLVAWEQGPDRIHLQIECRGTPRLHHQNPHRHRQWPQIK